MKNGISSEQVAHLKHLLGSSICEALEDESVTDIFLNDDATVWAKSREGNTKLGTMDAHRARGFLNQLAQLSDIYLNQENPGFDANLPFNKERIAATIEPMTKAPTFSIRKPSKEVFSLESYVEREVLTLTQYNVICKAMLERKNILISGGTQSGKTTLLNSCLLKMKELCGESQRLLILQDSDEIKSTIDNSVYFFVTDTVSMTKLLKTSMRYTPDKIIVGEVRDGACLDLLKAWNTGHNGGLSTLHANSAQSAALRLSYLAQEAGVPAPNYLIIESVDLIIQINKDSSASAGRRVESIASIKGFNNGQFIFEQIN